MPNLRTNEGRNRPLARSHALIEILVTGAGDRTATIRGYAPIAFDIEGHADSANSPFFASERNLPRLRALTRSFRASPRSPPPARPGSRSGGSGQTPRSVEREDERGKLRSGQQLRSHQRLPVRGSVAPERGMDARELAPGRAVGRDPSVGEVPRYCGRDLAAVGPNRVADRQIQERLYLPRPKRQVLPRALRPHAVAVLDVQIPPGSGFPYRALPVETLFGEVPRK